MRDSITNVRSSGLGSAVHEIKRHSKVKVPKVSKYVKKIKRAYGKTVRAQAKKQVKEKEYKEKIKRRVNKIEANSEDKKYERFEHREVAERKQKVTKPEVSKEKGEWNWNKEHTGIEYKKNKWGDRIYK
jgi:hypothetical protein